MSCTNYAVYISGVKFSLTKNMSMIPNPLYGKVKYNPDTGEKVEPRVFDKTKYDVINRFVENKYSNIFTTYDEYNGDKNYFCGILYKLSEEDQIKIPDILPQKPVWYSQLINMLKENAVPYEEGNFLVSHMSC